MLSVVSYPERGKGGRSSYRGNCSPKLIEDIINQYHIGSLCDFMVGSGTTEEVCKRMDVPGTYLDLNRGFDMIDMDIPVRAENIFFHPPYDNIITYSDSMYAASDVIDKFGFDPRTNDLSRCADWNEFIEKLNYCVMKQFDSMEKGGRMFVLMGDVKKQGKLFSMLCDIAKPGTLEQIIIKMQHNCVSYRKSYGGPFVPLVHEYLMVLKKENAISYQIKMSRDIEVDIRDSQTVTWRDVIAGILEDAGKCLLLSEIYASVEGHRKCDNNQNWKAKVRQTLYLYDIFVRNESEQWSVA